MDGINGLNTRTVGVSRDQIMGAANILRGAFLLAHDDPNLVPLARSVGMKTIFRASGDQGEALKINPVKFVQDRANAGADYIHLTNEVSDSPALHEWTAAALRAATALGVKAVAYNYGTNAPAASYEAARANIAYAVMHGHAIGVHVYLDGVHDLGAWDFLNIKHQLGGVWIATEFAYIRTIFDAEKGWRGVKSEDELSVFFTKTIPSFALENMPVCHFSFDDWPSDPKKKDSGFGLWQAGHVLYELNALNNVYKYEEKPVTTYVPSIPLPADAGLPIAGTLRTPTTINLRDGLVEGKLVFEVPNMKPVRRYPKTEVILSVGGKTYHGQYVEVLDKPDGKVQYSGYMALVAASGKWEDQIVPAKTLVKHGKVDVPFNTQNVGQFNLCMEACIADLDEWKQDELVGSHTDVSPLDVAKDIPDRPAGGTTTYDQGIKAALKRGIYLVKAAPSVAEMTAQIGDGLPFIADFIRKYIPGWKQIYAQDPDGPHLAVVDEYWEYSDGTVDFAIEDPLGFIGKIGDSYVVSARDLTAGMAALGKNAMTALMVGPQTLHPAPPQPDPTDMPRLWTRADILALIAAEVDRKLSSGK